MKTRKLLALLLVMVMSLTMGGLTAFAVDEPTPSVTTSGDPTDPTDPADPTDPTDPADPTDPGEGPDSTDKPTASIKVTDFPENAVKPGDTVSYTIEVSSDASDMSGWHLMIQDELKSEIDNLDIYSRMKVELKDKKATVTYTVPKNYFFSSDSYVCDIILTDSEADIESDEFWNDILARDSDHFIPTYEMELTSTIDFNTNGIVTGKEYPFTVSWTNNTDYAVDDFSTHIFTMIFEYNDKPTYKITDCPSGAVVNSEPGGVTVEKMSIPVGGTIKISGTVLYPAEGRSAQICFDEIINGRVIGQPISDPFTIKTGTGESGSTTQQPGTENKVNVKTDKATGITVSGLEDGVELSVKSVSDDKKAEIEKQVKKLVKNVKGIKIFDISLLKDGKEVQPGTPVKVTIPVPSGFSTNLKLYHQNGDVLEPVDITVKDSTISFEAKSFSPYVLVDLGAKAADTSNGKSPKTGDTSSMMLYLMLALAAMGSVGVVTRKKLNR